MTPYAEELQHFIKLHGNKEQQIPMEKYLKNQFVFLGIRKPELNRLLSSFLKEHGKPKQLVQVSQELWNLEEREFQYIALEILGKDAKKAESERMDVYEQMVVTKSWWDSVDTVTSKCIGVHFLKYPDLILPYTSKWMASDNMWLRRVAIIFQLRYRDKTNVELLFSVIEECLDSKEFFIQKAIGWALREYGKTDPQIVREFVRMHSLAPLSRREALKHIGE